MREKVSRLAASVFANSVRACLSSWMPRIRQVSSAGTETASASNTISLARNELNRGSQRALRRLSSDTDMLRGLLHLDALQNDFTWGSYSNGRPCNGTRLSL